MVLIVADSELGKARAAGRHHNAATKTAGSHHGRRRVLRILCRGWVP